METASKLTSKTTSKITSKITWLKSRLATRQEKNSAYSLRAFARDLGVSPALLSQIFSGQRNISGNTLIKISEKLELSPLEMQELFSAESLKSKAKHTKFLPMDADEFDVIADWYHFAILSLADVANSRFDAVWIAERLGIAATVAEDALRRLLRMGIIEKRGKGFKKITPPIDSKHDIPSAAVRKQHRQILQKAENSLLNDPIESRYFGAVTLAINSQDLPRAKKMLRRFRTEFAEAAESQSADRVYVLAFQFFPVDKI